MVDRRKDPTADTGLFEMIYKQNFPRTPPYLGMNLSIRGRRIFRNRSKAKIDKEKLEKEKIILKLRRQDLIKNEEPTISKVLPKIISPNSYNGPIIEDFIEEINKNVDKESGVNFVPAARTVASTASGPPQRKRLETKNERVSKYCSSKYKTNKSSLCRRQNAKENARRSSTAAGRVSSSSRYVSVFRDWTIINKMTSEITRNGYDNHNWEKKTASILKGTNILNKCSKYRQNEIDINSNIYNQDAFNLNKLLPHLNATLPN